MSQKRDDILLTKFDIEILEYLSNDKNKPFKKWYLYTFFKIKGNNRINDRLKNLITLEIIKQNKTTINNRTCKILKINKRPLTNFLIKNFRQNNTL